MDFITSVSELRFRYTQALIMVRSFRLVFVLTILVADSSGAAQVGTPTLVSIQTPRGATQSDRDIDVNIDIANACQCDAIYSNAQRLKFSITAVNY